MVGINTKKSDRALSVFGDAEKSMRQKDIEDVMMGGVNRYLKTSMIGTSNDLPSTSMHAWGGTLMIFSDIALRPPKRFQWSSTTIPLDWYLWSCSYTAEKKDCTTLQPLQLSYGFFLSCSILVFLAFEGSTSYNRTQEKGSAIKTDCECSPRSVFFWFWVRSLCSWLRLRRPLEANGGVIGKPGATSQSDRRHYRGILLRTSPWSEGLGFLLRATSLDSSRNKEDIFSILWPES